MRRLSLRRRENIQRVSPSKIYDNLLPRLGLKRRKEMNPAVASFAFSNSLHFPAEERNEEGGVGRMNAAIFERRNVKAEKWQYGVAKNGNTAQQIGDTAWRKMAVWSD